MEETSPRRDRFTCTTCARMAVTVHHPSGTVTLHESPDRTNHDVNGPIVPYIDPYALTPGYGTSRPAAVLTDSEGRAADYAAEREARRHF